MKLSTTVRTLLIGAALCAAAPLANAVEPAAPATASAAAATAVTPRYRLQRTALTRPGKFLDGVAFAKEISAYINSKYGIQVRTYAQSFGAPGTICWSSDWADLASIEAFNAQLTGDPKYWAIVNKAAAEVFVEDSVHDVLLQGF